MIAVILAAAERSELHGLDEHLPLPLFPLVDRPILHHVVDLVAALGVRRFEFVLGHLPEKVEAFLGDGARWGASFGFHLLPSMSDPLELAQTIAAGLEDDILLGTADTLPDLQLPPAPGPTAYFDEAGEWTGWAVLPRSSRSLAQLRSYRSGASLPEAVTVTSRRLSFRGARELLQSQAELLSGVFPASGISGRESKPGIWLSRNVSLHPTVELKPPVYIGPNCKIEMGVRLGPSVVVSDGSIIDERSSAAHSLVAPGTYIGQGLELESVIVDRNRLVNARLETGFLVSESFLLSGLTRLKRPRALHRLGSRLGALAIFILLLPISALTLLFLLLSGRGKVVRERAVSIPTIQDAHDWREYGYLRVSLRESTMAGWWTYFVSEVWLGLLSVMKGDLYLVGVKPRTKQEVERLPGDWRSLYLGSKGGLITEAFVMFGRSPDLDELYTAEAYYSAIQSIGHDLKLLRLYLVRLLTRSDPGPAAGFSAGSSNGRTLENVVER
jgi:NDP-sugar pyrophosphorylase family protein